MVRPVVLNLQAEARAFSATLTTAAVSLGQLSRNLRRATSASGALSGKSGQLGSRLARTSSAVTALATSVMAATQTIQTMGSIAGRAFGALESAVSGTVGQFAEFDAQVRQVAAAVGSSNLDGLAQTINRIGVESEFTVGQVAEAAKAAAQFGASERELEPFLDAAVKIAGVTGTEVPRALEIAKSQANAFGLEVKDLAQLSTLLIQATTGSGANMEKLATALQFAGPAAAGVGQEIGDVVPAIQALVSSGIEASIAGTTLRNLFTQLIGPTGEAKTAIESLGLSMADVDPRAVKLTDIIERFQDAGLDASQALAIFGKRFALPTLGLTRLNKEGLEGADVLKAYAKELGDVGAAEEKVGTIRDGVSFSLKQLSASFDIARTKIGSFIVEAFNLDERLGGAAKRVSALVGNLQKLTAGDFSDVVVKLIGDQGIEGIFLRAVQRVGEPLLRVVGSAFAFGARQILRFAPLIGEIMLKSFSGGLATVIPKLLAGFGIGISKLFTGALVSATEGLRALLDKVGLGRIAKDAGILGEAIALGTSRIENGISKLADFSASGLRGISSDLIDIDIGSSLKRGDTVTREAFGDIGTQRGLINDAKAAFAAVSSAGMDAARAIEGAVSAAANQRTFADVGLVADTVAAQMAGFLTGNSQTTTDREQRDLLQRNFAAFGGARDSSGRVTQLPRAPIAINERIAARLAAESSREARAERIESNRERSAKKRAAREAAIEARKAAATDDINDVFQNRAPQRNTGGSVDTVPTVVQDNRTQTIYGAKSSEAVRGPRDAQRISPVGQNRGGIR